MGAVRRLTVISCALMTFFSFSVQSAEPSINQPAAEKAAIRFLEALSTGPEQDLDSLSESLFSAKMRERVGPDRMRNMLDMLTDDFARIDATNAVREVTANGDKWDVLVVNDLGQHFLFALNLSGSTDPKISGIMVKPLPPVVPRVAPEDIAGTAEKYLASRVANIDFSGAVLLAKNSDIIYAHAFGMADLDTKRPNTLDTPLNLGSMNKMFTSLLIGRLVSDGTLSWDDKVGAHLPELPNKRIRDEVTLHQLLTHTSGVGSYWNQSYEESKHGLDSLDGFLATFINEPLLFDPGQGNAYSNGGPVILGLIVEKYMDMSYYEAVRRFIYQPAGMKHSDHYQTADKVAGLAVGYFQGPDGLVGNSEQLGLMGSPAGGGYASANDLLLFSNALASGKLLDRDTLEQMWTPYAELGPDFGYGYLWGIGSLNDRRWVGHNGGSPGVSADYRYYPESGYTVIVLANRDQIAAPVSDWLNELITRSAD